MSYSIGWDTINLRPTPRIAHTEYCSNWALIRKVTGLDPKTNPDAKRFDRLTYMETINRRLEVMDSTAISLCMENNLPILVLNLWDSQALISALHGEHTGTLVTA